MGGLIMVVVHRQGEAFCVNKLYQMKLSPDAISMTHLHVDINFNTQMTNQFFFKVLRHLYISLFVF
jgi:hypothetical protein